MCVCRLPPGLSEAELGGTEGNLATAHGGPGHSKSVSFGGDPSRLFKRLHYRLVNASAEEETLLTALSMHSVSFNTPCSFQCFSWDVRAPPCCIHCVIPQATHPALFLASVYEFHGCGLHQNHIQKSALIRSALLCAVVAVPMSVCVVCKMCCRLRVSLKVYLGALRGFRSVLLHI